MNYSSDNDFSSTAFYAIFLKFREVKFAFQLLFAK